MDEAALDFVDTQSASRDRWRDSIRRGTLLGGRVVRFTDKYSNLFRVLK